jgi:hypothetical protein
LVPAAEPTFEGVFCPVATVPEPSIWATIILGFYSVGFAPAVGVIVLSASPVDSCTPEEAAFERSLLMPSK